MLCCAWEKAQSALVPRAGEPFPPQALDSDEGSYREVTDAMRLIGFSAEEVESVHRILAAILHLVSLAPACLTVGWEPSPRSCPGQAPPEKQGGTQVGV